MMTSILQIIAALVGGAAVFYINKIVQKYMQDWQNEKNAHEVEKSKKEVSNSNENLQDQLDKLKDIDQP